MKRPKRPDENTPLWVAIVLIVVFGIAMFLSGYLVGRGG